MISQFSQQAAQSGVKLKRSKGLQLRAMGIDGFKSGWVCVSKRLASYLVEVKVRRSITELLLTENRPDLAMIDIPIGLSDSGPRDPDTEARKFLKAPRASSVFSSPIRSMLTAGSYTQACAIGRVVDGRALSKQCWAILAKIKEVDLFMRDDTSRQQWLSEVHPEVCFAMWNEGIPVMPTFE